MIFPPAIDRTMLLGPVRKALHSASAEVVVWECRPLKGAGPLSGDVFRLSGTACDHGTVLHWAVVLKVWRLTQEHDDPAHVFYWKREVLAYQSGLLDDLPDGLAAPDCYGVVDRGDGLVWLWLEDITDTCSPRWSLSCYGRAARHLGRFNGAYVMGRSLPVAGWLSDGWLRATLAWSAPAIAQLANMLDHPLVRQAYPAAVATDLLRLWSEREHWLARLDRLPRTFCHGDAYRRNLFLRERSDGSEQLVAIDWALTGIGALGEELGSFIPGALIFYDVDLAQARDLEDIALAGYVMGLREAGWQGDARLVRWGYMVTAALRFGPGLLTFHLRLLRDESLRSFVEPALGHPLEEFAGRFAAILQLLLAGVEDARDLLRTLA